MRIALLTAAACGLITAPVAFSQAEPAVQPRPLRAGAAAVDVSPEQFPAVVSGGFLEKQAAGLNDPLYARSLVLDDGTTAVAIAVVDTLLMPRQMLDEVKAEIYRKIGIPTDRILIAATHTHSAPSVVGALGTGVDEHYVGLLPGRIVTCVCRAAESLAPAKVGWTRIAAPEHTNCRRWIRRPDRLGEDPFGGRTVRAMMHPGYQNPDYIGPAGPEDPWLSLLAVQSLDGRPIALLANYSMHYYGAAPVSADYFGRFVRIVTERIAGANESSFVAMMSQGTSGDLHWMDYSRPAVPRDIDVYAEGMATAALGAYKTIEYHQQVPLAMAETTLTLRRRLPDDERLAWARQMVEAMGGRKPKDRPEVYALEQLHLAAEPERELKLQALRVGEVGITAIPCEVYGITGLKIKAQSPLDLTFNIELANGTEGYIPPPEQHKLGGYTTWPARSAGLEEGAEPRIVETLLRLLEEIAGRPRRRPVEPQGPYALAVLASQPLAYWRLGEFQGPKAIDSSAGGNHGTFEDGVAFYLEGPEWPGLCGGDYAKRAAHFAGGRMKADFAGLAPDYSVELWFWNGLSNDARPVVGYLFSRGPDGSQSAEGDHLGIAGTADVSGGPAPGRLLFYNGNSGKETLVGRTEIEPRTWNHLVMVRAGASVRVYFNGDTAAEISGEVSATCPADCGEVFIGGRNDGFANFEGKICEVAVYGRALTPDEVARHYAAAGEEQEGWNNGMME